MASALIPFPLAIPTLYLSIIGVILLQAQATESPHYEVMLKGTDFEIRLYKDVSWLSASVQGNNTSFQNSTKDGFHRLYQYVHGGNLNSSTLAMTAPVLTMISQSSQVSAKCFVKLFLSPNYGANPPLPNPELNLQLEKWSAKCIGVRKFSGFAKDDNVKEEVDALVSSLNEQLTGNATVLVDKNSFSIAQYNASYHLTGRVNEVWMNVSASAAESFAC